MKYIAHFPMNSEGIGRCMLYIEETLKLYRIDRRDLLEALLISEEVLMQLQEHASENAKINVVIARKLGVPRIKLTAAGTPIDMEESAGTVSIEQLDEGSENSIRSIMLRSYSSSIKYRYNKSGNVVNIVTGIPERVLATKTVTAIVLACLIGFFIQYSFSPKTVMWFSTKLFAPMEELFISALMCITAPAVFASITCSMFRFDGFSELGDSGKKVVSKYIVTSVIATIVGGVCFLIFKPGKVNVLSSHVVEGQAEGFSLYAILTDMIPPNIVEPFISVNSIQLTIAAMVIGTALNMSGKRTLHIKSIFEELDVLCGQVSSMVMDIVPVVVFCSTVNVIITSRTEIFISTLQLILTILVALAIMVVIYCVILLFEGRLNPLIFFKKYSPAMKTTFLRGSGVAAIPSTMRICRRRFGVPQNICSFTIPLGATINMDGNCICLIISSLFFARCCGMALDTNTVVLLLLLVLVLSLGAPIAPGTLILCLVTLMTQMGIDTSVLSIIIGINFILEMLLGMVNSTGDVVIALIVARNEGTLDMDVYNKI